MLDEDEDEAQTDDARRARSDDDDDDDVIVVNVVENVVAFVHITHSLVVFVVPPRLGE